MPGGQRQEAPGAAKAEIPGADGMSGRWAAFHVRFPGHSCGRREILGGGAAGRDCLGFKYLGVLVNA